MSFQSSAAGDFSPLFSNATVDHATSGQHLSDPTADQKRSIQKRSEPDGDHHLKFVDLDDSTARR